MKKLKGEGYTTARSLSHTMAKHLIPAQPRILTTGTTKNVGAALTDGTTKNGVIVISLPVSMMRATLAQQKSEKASPTANLFTPLPLSLVRLNTCYGKVDNNNNNNNNNKNNNNINNNNINNNKITTTTIVIIIITSRDPWNRINFQDTRTIQFNSLQYYLL